MRIAQMLGRDSKAARYSIPQHFRTAPCENFGGVLTLVALTRKEPPGANALQGAAHPLNLPSHCNGFHGFSPCALALFGRQSA